MNRSFILSILLIVTYNVTIVHSQDLRMVSERVKEVLADTDIMEYDTFATRYMAMDETDRCQVCMSVIVPVVEILRESNIQGAVLNGLHTSCDTLGLLFRGTCNDFVDALIPPIFSILLDVLPEANCGAVVGNDPNTLCSSDISYDYLAPQQDTRNPPEENPEADPTVVSIAVGVIGFLMSIFCTATIVHRYHKKRNERNANDTRRPSKKTFQPV